MTARLALAGAVAIWSAVLLNFALQRRARAEGDDRVGLRALGGVVLVLATLLGLTIVARFPGRITAAVLVAVALAFFGLLDERRSLPSGVRLVALVVASVVAFASGVRIETTGVGAADLVVTVAWLSFVTNGVRRLDATDGLAASIGAAIATGVFALAAFGDQGSLAGLALATGGACVGFLAYNVRPASTFLHDAGGYFLGFVLATSIVELALPARVVGRAAVPLLLVVVPITNLGLIWFTRLRRSGNRGTFRRDHLYHRIKRRGFAASTTVGLLVAWQLVAAVIAVFVGRGIIVGEWGVVALVVLTGSLVALAGSTSVRRRSVPKMHPRLRLVLVGGAVVAAAALVGGIYAVWDSSRLLDDGRSSVSEALAAARVGELEAAHDHFQDAAEAFRQAEARLGGPLSFGFRIVPVVGPNVDAAGQLSEVGHELARAGERLTSESDSDALRVVNGTLPLAEIERITPNLEEGAALLEASVDELDGIEMEELVGPVRDVVEEVDADLHAAQREARNGVIGARLAGELFGGDGPRRYFLAVQNTAELRGTGGLIGNWGILTAENGRISLEDIRRTAELNEPVPPEESARTLDAPEEYLRRYERFHPAQDWRNINMSPDFPTVAGVITDLYPQAGGEPVDGVIAVDPEGLAALLRLTGPIQVEGYPVPITADNVLEVTLVEAYDLFDQTDRIDFIGDVAETAVDVATSIDLGRPAIIGQVLGEAAREGHLMAFFTRPEEQQLSTLLETDGGLDPVESDALSFTTQNAAGNKLDYYLGRSLSYDVELVPGPRGQNARVTGNVALTLRNDAPASGHSAYAIGPFDERFVAGQNRSFVSVYTPLGFSSPTFDGAPTTFESAQELGRTVASTYVDLPSGASGTLAFDVDGKLELEPGGWYRLDLDPQPSLHPDTVSVTVGLPDGWRVVETIGFDVDDEGRAVFRGDVSEETSLWMRVGRGAQERTLWERLVDGPAPESDPRLSSQVRG